MGRYSTHYSVETTVKGGFPVLVKGVVCFPDYSVGINGYWAEDIEIATLRDKPCKFMEAKLTKAEWLELEHKLVADYKKNGRSDDY